MRYDRFDWSGYFEWLVGIIDDGEHDDMLPVLSYLWKKEFVWSNGMDANRAKKGIDLREEYADIYECRFTCDDRKEPCSVLEMLVRLAMDVENNVVGVPGEERPDIWFWEWLENLKIDDRCTGRGYSKDYHDQCIDNWLDGNISRSGKRSPFPLKHSRANQRDKDIWMQCMAYVNEKMRYW